MKVMSPRQFNLFQRNKTEDSKQKKIENLKKARAAKEEKKVPIEDLIEMRCYIKYNLYYGQPKEKIIQALTEQGWKRDEIEIEVKNINAPPDYILKNGIQRKVMYNTPIQQKAKTIIPQPKKTIEEDIVVPLPPQSRN